jgi:hypothetical protein
MPAARSSTIAPAIGYLAQAVDAGGRPRLLQVLARVTDPRARRGVRHRLETILRVAVCAVLAGARSYVAIAEWAADADEAIRAELGMAGSPPSESTIRRVLQRLDAEAFDAHLGAWAQQATTPPGGRVVCGRRREDASGVRRRPGSSAPAGRVRPRHRGGPRPGRRGGGHERDRPVHRPGRSSRRVRCGRDRRRPARPTWHVEYWPPVAGTTWSRSRPTSPRCTPNCGRCPGGTSPSGARPQTAPTAGSNAVSTRSSPSPPDWRSPTPPRPSRSPAAAGREAVVDPDRLRGHLPDRRPGHTSPARRAHPRALVDRGPPALGP